MTLNRITNWIFVSTEDDRLCVKGGIGTYIGTLTNTLKHQNPEISIEWVAESPSEETFEEVDLSLTRTYLSRYSTCGEKLSIVDFAQKFQTAVRQKIFSILSGNPKARIIIEAPEWEGLLADLYEEINDKRILKISRNHTPLIMTAGVNRIQLTGIFADQVQREKRQIEHSDVLSAPTQYVLKQTILRMWR